MFVGHLAAALGAKAAEPRVPLATFVGAAFALDLIWPIFVLAGIEVVRIDPGNTAFTPAAFDDYPWSHSLVMSVVWGSLLAAAAARRAGAGAMALVAATVVSHWLLDFVSHRPDLPLWPGSAEYGLGLWDSIAATFVVEGLTFGIAVAVYRARFPARDRTGGWSFLLLVAFTTVIWISGPFSPPPPSATAIAVVALAMWLFLPWTAWIGRHRAGG